MELVSDQLRGICRSQSANGFFATTGHSSTRPRFSRCRTWNHQPLLGSTISYTTKDGNKRASLLPGWLLCSSWHRWDEWVPLGRALRYTEENHAKQKALQKTNTTANQAAANKAKTREGAGAPGPSRTARKDGTRGTKRGRDDDESTRKPEMKLTVPEPLKAILVDDWEAVTKNNQLVNLPRNPNVVQILALFEKHVLEKRPPELRQPEVLIHAIISGLQVYFDRSLGSQLLYRFERPQYAVVRQTYVTGADVDVSKIPEMSAIYGAEHLLRMLVSLPQMVAASLLDAELVGLIRDYVNELLSYLAAKKEILFLLEYQPASLQYQNISRS